MMKGFLSAKCPECNRFGVRPVNIPFGVMKCRFCHQIFKPELDGEQRYLIDSDGRYVIDLDFNPNR